MVVYIGLISIVIIVICGTNTMYRKTNFYDNLYEDIRKYKKVPDKIKVANFGSTFSRYAFEYEKIEGFNFSTNAQCYEEDFNLLKSYRGRIQKGATIFITCADFEFLFTGLKKRGKIFRSEKYVKICDKKYWKGINWIKVIVKLYFPLLLKPGNIKYVMHDVDKYDKIMLEYNPMSQDQIENDVNRRLDTWNRMFSLDLPEKWEVTEENKAAIEKNIEIVAEMIQYCKENGFIPYLISMPVSESLKLKLPEKMLDEFLRKPAKRISDKYNVPFWDFTKDSSLNMEEYYINSACLNRKGRTIFMNLVNKRLEQS